MTPVLWLRCWLRQPDNRLAAVGTDVTAAVVGDVRRLVSRLPKRRAYRLRWPDAMVS